MRLNSVLLIFVNLIVITMLILYMVNPGGDIELSFDRDVDANFNIGNATSHMQFYPNMRFASTNISYRIDPECSLEKTASLQESVEIINNLTVLTIYPVDANEQISMFCSEKVKIEDRMFIAGEGGPTNITDAGRYRVILAGSILLIRDTKCPTPIVGVHELLHVLGFDHSDNKHNILYPVARCSQTIGDDMIERINELYSEPSYADLVFNDAHAERRGRYLHVNLSIRNNGLVASDVASIAIYNNGKVVKELELDSLEVGHGIKIDLSNIWLSTLKTEEIKVVISSNFSELSIDNNEIYLSKQ